MAKTILTFSVDSERDRDILVYLDAVPSGEKSLVFRQALRAYVTMPTNVEIYQKLVNIETMLKNRVVSVKHDNTEGSDDPRIGAIEAKLKGLGE